MHNQREHTEYENGTCACGLALTSEVAAGLVATVLFTAHEAQLALDEAILPAWVPSKRGLVTHVLRVISSGAVFTDAFVQDLDTFVLAAERLVDCETEAGWEADENHSRGGYPVTIRSVRAMQIEGALPEIYAFREALLAAMSALEALRRMPELLDG